MFTRLSNCARNAIQLYKYGEILDTENIKVINADNGATQISECSQEGTYYIGKMGIVLSTIAGDLKACTNCNK